MKYSVPLMFTLSLVCACKGGGESAGAGGSAEITLPKIGLKGLAPSGSEISDMMGDEMVSGPGLVVTVGVGDKTPATGEEAQTDAAMYNPKNAKLEKLDDGYLLSFTNEGSAGTNYWVSSRRQIAGKAVSCSTTASSQAQMDNAISFCKSLKP